MKTFITLASLALFSTVTFASSLIECEGIDNPNIGIVKIITNKSGNQSQNVLVASYNNGTSTFHLSDVAIDLKSKEQINHSEANGTRLSIEISEDLLTDGSNTIRPYFFKSKVYFEVGGSTLINSRYLKCRVFNNL